MFMKPSCSHVAQELFLRYQIFLKPMISAWCFVLHLSDSISWALPQCIGIITIMRKYWMKQWVGPLLFQLCSSGAVSYTEGLLCVSLCSPWQRGYMDTAHSFCDVNGCKCASQLWGCLWLWLAATRSPFCSFTIFLHPLGEAGACARWVSLTWWVSGHAHVIWGGVCLLKFPKVVIVGEIKSRGSPWPGIFSSHQNPELTWANWRCVATTVCKHRIAAVGWLSTLKFSITGAGLGNMPTAIL